MSSVPGENFVISGSWSLLANHPLMSPGQVRVEQTPSTRSPARSTVTTPPHSLLGDTESSSTMLCATGSANSSREPPYLVLFQSISCRICPGSVTPHSSDAGPTRRSIERHCCLKLWINFLLLLAKYDS